MLYAKLHAIATERTHTKTTVDMLEAICRLSDELRIKEALLAWCRVGSFNPKDPTRSIVHELQYVYERCYVKKKKVREHRLIIHYHAE